MVLSKVQEHTPSVELILREGDGGGGGKTCWS